MVFILIIVTLLSVLACYQIAKLRDADSGLWALLGLLLGPFAIPFAFLAKPKKIQ